MFRLIAYYKIGYILDIRQKIPARDVFLIVYKTRRIWISEFANRKCMRFDTTNVYAWCQTNTPRGLDQITYTFVF